MEKQLIIDTHKYEKSWEMFSQNILKMVVPKLKTLGYELHISDEYLNIDGMYYWFKHPQRIAKLVLNIRTDISSLSNNGININEIHIGLSLNNSINLITEYQNAWLDYTDIYQPLAFIDNIKKNTFKFPKLDFSKVSELKDEITKFDNFVFKTTDNKMNSNFIEMVHGPFDNKNSDFSSLENYIAWLEWLGIDVTEFAIAHKNVDLLPQTAKDVFLF